MYTHTIEKQNIIYNPGFYCCFDIVPSYDLVIHCQQIQM